MQPARHRPERSWKCRPCSLGDSVLDYCLGNCEATRSAHENPGLMHGRPLVWAGTGLLVVLLGYASSLQAAAVSSWPTYQHDAARSGADTSQTSVTNPTPQWTTVVDGQVNAQPLFFNNQVLVATQNDSVYALDPSTGAVVWTQHLGTAVYSGLPCGGISPVGITSTPPIAPAATVLYPAGLSPHP